MGDQETQGILTNKFERDEMAALAFARAMIRNGEQTGSGMTRSSAQGVPMQDDRKMAHQLDTQLSTSTTKKSSWEVPNKEKPGSSIARSHSAIATMVPEGTESWSAYSAFASGQSTMRSPSLAQCACTNSHGTFTAQVPQHQTPHHTRTN